MPDEMGGAAEEAEILHASAVAFEGKACLILGPSGSGKSTLAFELIALGASLVADDRVVLTATATELVASSPGPILGMIEARGVGLLASEPAPPTPLGLVIDLSRTETERLPPERHTTLLGRSVPCLHKVASPVFAVAIRQYMRLGRRA